MTQIVVKEQAERLHGIFSPIFQFWNQNSVAGSLLHEQAAGLDDYALLRRDITRIGMWFATADDLGMRAELALTAEYLAWLRSQPPQVAAKFEALTEQELAGLEKMEHPAQEDIPVPLCWKIAHACHRTHYYSEDAVKALREAILATADHFCMYDGIITPEEDTRRKAFHAALD